MRKLAAVGLLILAGALGVCASLEPLAWPPAPQKARLRLIKEFNGRAKLVEPGRLGKLLRALLGLAPGGSRRGRRLINPTGLYVRGRTLYVADPGARGVLRYDEKENKTDWLPKGRGIGMVSPVAVVAAPGGRVFVADSALGKVIILAPDGKPDGELRGDPQGMGRPAGLALGPDRLFVSDVKGHRVSVYGLDGGFIHSFGRRGTGPGEFNFPTYLWYDGVQGVLWVCDSGNFRVQKMSPLGQPLGSFGKGGDRPGFLARPRGLALDSDGNVYLVDGAFEAVQIFDKTGRLLLFVGRSGAAPGEFSLPGGVFAGSDDRIFVADTFNGRVQIFQYLKEKGR